VTASGGHIQRRFAVFRINQIAIAATAVCLCTPAAAQARPLGDHVPSPSRDYQKLNGADAQGAPASADEFPAPTPAPRVRIVEVPSPGIDLGDATIGAGGAVVLALLATATGMTVTRRRAAT
jgi:hypothetical protein